MPKVDLTATRDFTYMTRRLTAGDPFQARNPLEARILKEVRKVAADPKPAKVAPKVEEVLTAEVVEEAPVADAPKAAAKKAPAKRKAKARK
jgi:hypothetical protein